MLGFFTTSRARALLNPLLGTMIPIYYFNSINSSQTEIQLPSHKYPINPALHPNFQHTTPKQPHNPQKAPSKFQNRITQKQTSVLARAEKKPFRREHTISQMALPSAAIFFDSHPLAHTHPPLHTYGARICVRRRANTCSITLRRRLHGRWVVGGSAPRLGGILALRRVKNRFYFSL